MLDLSKVFDEPLDAEDEEDAREIFGDQAMNWLSKQGNKPHHAGGVVADIIYSDMVEEKDWDSVESHDFCFPVDLKVSLVSPSPLVPSNDADNPSFTDRVQDPKLSPTSAFVTYNVQPATHLSTTYACCLCGRRMGRGLFLRSLFLIVVWTNALLVNLPEFEYCDYRSESASCAFGVLIC